MIVMLAVTGSFRRFERFAIFLVFGSLPLVPAVLIVHPPVEQITADFLVSKLPKDGNLSEVMLLIIAIVGTTVAPWQLFFQQSYLIDKRITPRFIHYERWDLCLGIALVILGAVAMISFSASIFAGKPEFGNYTDALGTAMGLQKYAGRLPAVLFARPSSRRLSPPACRCNCCVALSPAPFRIRIGCSKPPVTATQHF